MDEVAEAVQAFFYETEEAIAQHPLWHGCEPEELDKACDALEKFVTTKLYDKVFLTDAEERENEGLKYYTIEYTAKAKNFTRHSLTVLAVQKGKLYTITTGANERRWPKMQDKLKFVAKSFTLL